MSIVEVHQKIAAVLVTPEQPRRSSQTGSAAPEMQRTYTTSDAEVAQFTVNTHPSSRYRHSMTMRRVKG